MLRRQRWWPTGRRPVDPQHPAGSRLWPLALVAALVMLLAGVGVLPAWPGLVQLVALPPLDHFADLRVLLTETASVPGFLALLVVVLAVRVVVLALLLGGLSRGRLVFAALCYGLSTPVLLMAAMVDFASYAVLYSRMFWGAVTMVALLVVIVAPAVWQAAPAGAAPRLRTGLRNSFRQGLRVAVLVPYALVLVGVGALADLGGPVVTIALVPVSALATAVAVRWLAAPPPVRPLRQLALVVAAAVVVGVGFVTTRTVEPAPPAPPQAGSLLLMSGINSSSGSGSIFEADVARLGYGCDQVYYYSYAGPGDGAPQGDATCPIRTGAPYDPGDTMRPVAQQVEFFAGQVRDLPRPLVVAGHSLGAWVAWESVATGAAPQVDVLILVGPFPDSPVGYPPAGERAPGRVAGDLMRLLAPVVDLVDFHFEPDAPAARELLATPNAGARVFGQPLPDELRSISITSATDLPLMPGGWRLSVDHNACPVREAHPYLPETPALYHEVNRFQAGEPPPACPPWRDWGAPMARPFGVPTVEDRR